ncbi:MAG TPA: serine hydrolase domain-containing protein, partial [Pyrinomonadaceae bacterium]|nr:serine hydrolase domain-containing protein [Pyrinomonadaceae bacterium]
MNGLRQTNVFRILGALLLLAFAPGIILAAGPPPEAPGERPAQGTRKIDFSELEKVVEAELKETGTPGAAVAVISDGRVIFAKGFGVTSVEAGGVPVTPDTLFRLGSTTKMFTGAALVTLSDKGRIKLDEAIGKYAKGLPPRLSQVTAHQLLSNNAGVGDFSAPPPSHDDAALATMIRSWKDDVMFGEPGKVYSYASPGFWLAGYVLEETGGKPYADMMDELLFQPLGMRRTTFRPLVAMTYPLAVGHAGGADGKPAVIRPAYDNVAQWPAGSIFSSANDLSRWVMALLSEGRLDGAQVLSPTLFKRMSGEHVAMPGAPEVHYGYGLLNFEDRGVQMVMHGGFSRGYGSMIQLAPEQRFAVIVVTNKSGITLSKTTEKARELVLPLKPAEAEKPKERLTLSAADVANFTGKYVNGPQTWEIVAKEGKLFLKDPEAEYELTRTGAQMLSFGDKLENDVALVPGADGKTEYIFTGLYSAR